MTLVRPDHCAHAAACLHGSSMVAVEDGQGLLEIAKTMGCQQVHLVGNSGQVTWLATAARQLHSSETQGHAVVLCVHVQVTPEKYLQRCSIVAPSGEECVLTFNVVLQEALECQ